MTGWINKALFLEWFQFFVERIPPARPVLLIMDGHGSHVTVDLIELARENSIHLLCLPSHTSHILQPLDVGVFKSFKTSFSKACRRYLGQHPGRVITADVLAALVAEAYQYSHTALNIMSGFRKTGTHPLNPGEVSDRQLAPSKIFQQPKSSDVSFTPEQIALFQTRYEEGYDLEDPTYSQWLKLNHPVAGATDTVSQVSSASKSSPSSVTTSKVSVASSTAGQSVKSSEEVLDELLVLPQVVKSAPGKQKRAPAINDRAKCITDLEVLEALKAQQEAKAQAEEEKKAKRIEREKKSPGKEEVEGGKGTGKEEVEGGKGTGKTA